MNLCLVSHAAGRRQVHVPVPVPQVSGPEQSGVPVPVNSYIGWTAYDGCPRWRPIARTAWNLAGLSVAAKVRSWGRPHFRHLREYGRGRSDRSTGCPAGVDQFPRRRCVAASLRRVDRELPVTGRVAGVARARGGRYLNEKRFASEPLECLFQVTGQPGAMGRSSGAGGQRAERG